MKSQLYIPKKIKVGFQQRSDTYTKKLAYVIYYDDKGVLRKEKSWKGWCDSKIPSKEFENVPHEGFHLNKGVQRNGYYGGGRSMCRIYDDRGFEFEITIDNLMFILMGSDCLKRGLEGKYIYSWNGNELVLLPENCEEYQQSIKYTDLQGKSIGVADLVPGLAYKTKQQEDLIYLGKFNWFEQQYYGNKASMLNEHVFYSPNRKFYHSKCNSCSFHKLSNLETLAVQTTDTPISNYAELVDQYMNSAHGSKITSLEILPLKVKYNERSSGYFYGRLPKGDENKTALDNIFFTEVEPNKYQAHRIYEIEKVKHSDTYRGRFEHLGYKIVPFKTVLFNGTDITIKSCSKKDTKLYTKAELEAIEFKQLSVNLSSKKNYTLNV